MVGVPQVALEDPPPEDLVVSDLLSLLLSSDPFFESSDRCRRQELSLEESKRCSH